MSQKDVKRFFFITATTKKNVHNFYTTNTVRHHFDSLGLTYNAAKVAAAVAMNNNNINKNVIIHHKNVY